MNAVFLPTVCTGSDCGGAQHRAGHLLLGLADLLLLAVEKLKALALILLDKARSAEPAVPQIGQPAGAQP